MDIDLEAAEALFQQDKQIGHSGDPKDADQSKRNEERDSRDDRGGDERKSKKKKHGKSSRSRSSKKKSKKHRSRSRSDSGKRKHKHRSGSAKKDRKDRKRSRSNDQQRSSGNHNGGDSQRYSAVESIELRKKELESHIERLQKEAEEATREDLTLMMYQIPTRADEKDIWTYLTKHCGCSKVRDIKLIRDQKTKRFKGVAYAEFYTKDDIDLALASDTRPFWYRGEEVPMSEVRVQRSLAERNRAAYAAKLARQQKQDALRDQLARLQEGPVKIFVSGLGGKLTTMTSQELKDIFQQFGEIEQVELPQNANGQNLGFGYVLFKHKNDAQEAIAKMNDFQLQDQKIKCTSVPAQINLPQSGPYYQNNNNNYGNMMNNNYGGNNNNSGGYPTFNHNNINIGNQHQFQQNQQDYNDRIDLDQNENSIYLHTAQKRLELMKKLAGNSVNIPGLDNSASTNSQAGGQNNSMQQQQQQQSQVSNSYLQIPGISIPSLNIASNQMVQNNFLAGNRPPTSMVPTNFIVLVNMFSEKDSENDPSFFADLKEDVGEECKKFGEVTDVFVAVKSPCGSVFVLFTNQQSAVGCAKAMDGRNFNHRPISCYCITEDTLQEELQKNL